MASPIVHFQLAAKDIDAAKKFYGEVMGWEFPESEEGGVADGVLRAAGAA